MQNFDNRVRSVSLALFVVVAGAAAASAAAEAAAELSGQWVGNSGIEGGRGGEKTTLSLGAPDAANSSLRIEGRTVCSLRDGSYSAEADGAVTLSFKGANGSEACERLAKGKFTLRQNAARKLSFQASYPGADGAPNLRSGVLNRYP